MGPAERRSLEAALVELNTQQSDAIQDATYLGWTLESQLAFEDRLRRITELRGHLGEAGPQ
jgi:hypothetical protein